MEGEFTTLGKFIAEEKEGNGHMLESGESMPILEHRTPSGLDCIGTTGTVDSEGNLVCDTCGNESVMPDNQTSQRLRWSRR